MYEPALMGLNHPYDLVVSRYIIAFDEVNNPMWPGETEAYLEYFKDKSVDLKKFPFEPVRSYFVKK